MKARFAALALVALVCAFGTAPSSAAAPSPSFKDVPPAPAPVSLVPDDYKIGPQDTLDVSVFQVSDLSKTVRVDTGGTIFLPLIGSVAASGRTAKELSDDLAT